jgi:small conductance mechanosensitive channel
VDSEQLKTLMASLSDKAVDVGAAVAGALLLFLIGRWLIGAVVRFIQGGLETQKVDPTVLRYLGSTITVILNIVLVVAILGYFGVETTSFAALIAAAGVAIGMAWSGLLANFAAGAFLVVLRPFKVGDYIAAAGIEGTVRKIGLFTTTVDTPDNVITYVGNNKLFADNIRNFSANPYRRVELTAQLSQTEDVPAAIAKLKAGLAAIPNVVKAPAPDVEILSFTLAGPVLAVRPYCNTDHYWQVYFDSNRLIASSGFAVPAPQYLIRQ